jgi:hypothetical protein
LTQQFGSEYEKYRNRVPMLFPKVEHWRLAFGGGLLPFFANLYQAEHRFSWVKLKTVSVQERKGEGLWREIRYAVCR